MKKLPLSVLIITKNSQEVIDDCLKSIKNLAKEIIIVDDYSQDKTVEVAKKYKAKIYLNHENNLGRQRNFALQKTSNDWVLVLDSDERLSPGLKNEIKQLFTKENNQLKNISGFYLPFQNHFLGKKIFYGGENYKMLRLFKKNKVLIKPLLVHEHFEIKKGKVGFLKNKIYHLSYRSLRQVFKKFTDYAIREAKQKLEKGEESSLKKIFLYPIHMFYARFIKDKGYKDGFFRIPLDLGFAYMEFLTYLLIFFERQLKVKIIR